MKCEGLSSSERGRSSSAFTLYGIQYGVHCDSLEVVHSATSAEMSEMKELLKRQQEQLSQLTKSIATHGSHHG